MKILFLTHAFNGLAQRLFIELRELGHEVAIELDVNDALTAQALALAKPDLVIAPFLKRAIPERVWSAVPCLIVHPGVPGDRGPSALDWAILGGEREWGVTVLQAVGEMDAGPVWAHRAFPMRLAPKSSLYRREVTEAAVTAVTEAVKAFARGEKPVQAEDLGAEARGRARPLVRQADRAIDWAADDTLTVLRKIHSADGFPGIRDEILGRPVRLFGAHAEGTLRGPVPGGIVATRHGGILRATRDGAVWISHLQAIAPEGGDPTLKLPATEVLGDALAGVAEIAYAVDAPPHGDTWRELRYEEHGDVGVLHFAFHNGAMSPSQCRRLLAALQVAKSRPTKVLVLAGGEDFWSNGIHLNAIEATGRPADASWESINAIDDVAREIITMTERLAVAALAGNAGAGGVFLALAADRVWLNRGVVLNPHYKGMGNLYGSEYWTYLLPRRVGEKRAREITERRLPMGSHEAVQLGLADARFGHDPHAFLAAAVKRAQAMADDPRYADTLFAKRRQRLVDETAKPLDKYREEELERMKLNFYGFDPSYHVARYHFVHKLPKARTPYYLASHRAGAPG
ncbi:MAG: hydrogenase maturation protein [Burkholderiales bacterium]|nr:hydrogenase maturation protein [Burkholderiales bacterium]MCL4689035.1 hydrogenase maturation protein [Burkholderiales bacterium]